MIYFVYSPKQDAVKIGFTKNFKKRLSGIQSSCSDKLQTLLLIDGGNKLETELHEKFHTDKLVGEWFRYSDSIKEFILTNTSLSVEDNEDDGHRTPVRFDKELLNDLRAFCKAAGEKISVVIRLAVREYLNKHGDKK